MQIKRKKKENTVDEKKEMESTNDFNLLYTCNVPPRRQWWTSLDKEEKKNLKKKWLVLKTRFMPT